MALIKCPECGKEVSSSAKMCPQCGYPIAENNPVGQVYIRINLPRYVRDVVIYNGGGTELWRGKTGNVAVLNVDGPTDITIKGRMADTKAIVKAGEKYELGSEMGLVFPKDVFRRVDVIDSGR